MVSISSVNQNLVDQSEVSQAQGSLGERRVEDVTGQVAELTGGSDREVANSDKKAHIYVALAILGLAAFAIGEVVLLLGVCPPLGIFMMAGGLPLWAFNMTNAISINRSLGSEF